MEALSVDRISTLIENEDCEALQRAIAETPHDELVHLVGVLDAGARSRLIEVAGIEAAADLLEQLPAIQAQQLLAQSEPEQTAAVIDELPSDFQADLLREMEDETAEEVLKLIQPDDAASARQLREYDDLTAGGLMITEFLQYPETWTIEQVVQDLRDKSAEYRDYQVQDGYVNGAEGQLLGVLRLRDLLLQPKETRLAEIMIPNPLSVDDHMPLAELHGFFQQHHFIGTPVVNEAKALVGVLQRGDVDQARIEQQDRSFLKRQGIVSGEEIRSMPLLQRSGGRQAWLSLNIVLNLMAAAIISHFESTLAAVIALAAFLPIISDMSGCSGNQAVAVSIRELMLGIAKPADAFRVWMKEISIGVINGLAVGTLLGGIAWFWKGNVTLGLVVGVALMLNTMVAVSIGGVVPLLLRKLGKDPAVASGPLLTTVTDMCGFFLVLSLASVFIEQLKM